MVRWCHIHRSGDPADSELFLEKAVAIDFAAMLNC